MNNKELVEKRQKIKDAIKLYADDECIYQDGSYLCPSEEIYPDMCLDCLLCFFSNNGVMIADKVGLPYIPESPVYSDKPYDEVEKQAFRVGALTYRNAISKAGYLPCYPLKEKK